MTERIDIMISGGGMVGMSLALALARLGLSVVVVERLAMPAQLEPEFDGRVSALALGSVRLLQSIGAWEGMHPYAEPIRDIRVSDGAAPFFVHYDHRDIGDEPFGYIVENRHIRHALSEAAARYPSLRMLDRATVASFRNLADAMEVTLDNARIFHAALLLGAEGKHSPVREMAGIPHLQRDYEQTAIVCTIAHEKPHHGLAQERFLPAGPFAVLPMQGNRSSLVWVEPRERVQLYLDLPKEACEQEITERVGSYLGRITLEGSRFSYPLSLIHARRYIAPRLALLGDAAHGMHPIAGQGVNLGFRDVAVLEELIRKQHALGGDLGAEAMLARYQRWRRFDNVSMLAVTDGLNRLFCSDLLPVHVARRVGMWGVQRMPGLKRFFMRHAMGLVGDLPETFQLSKKTGFTLIELSVVLVVVGIISAMGIAAGIDALEATRRVATETKMDVVEEALLNFRKIYGRLPCPADARLAIGHANYGLEAANPGSCQGGTPEANYISTTGDVPSGGVPVRSLGLPDEFMVDGWERKFHYEVTPAMTAEEAFLHTQPGSNCGITVRDHANAALALQPVYDLVSHGKNGIGAYLKGGTQYTAGTAGTAEQTNIRTTSAPPTIRVKNAVSGEMGTAGYYDDIVRFKSLYQLLDQSQRDTVRYSGPELVVGYSSGSLMYGQPACGRFQDFGGSATSTVSGTVGFVAFAPGNTHLFVYGNSACYLYYLHADVLSSVSAGTPVPGCPSTSTRGAMAQDRGTLVLNANTAPYARVWKLIGTAAAAEYVEISNAFDPPFSPMPDQFSFSNGGEWLAVARAGSTTSLYAKKGERYQGINLTLPGAPGSSYNNAISPNGRYYAVASVSSGNTLLYVWRNVNGVYTQVTDSPRTLASLSAPNLLRFSGDSNDIVVAGTGTTSGYVVHINAASDVLTASSSIDFVGTPTDVGFSRDGRWLAASIADTDADSLRIYRRSGSVTFTEDTTSNFTYPGSGNGAAIAFRR